MIVFSVLYIMYRLPINLYKLDIIPLIKDIIKGEPMFHMWYLYMLIGVYVLAPVVYSFMQTVSEKQFEIVAFLFLVLSCISRWTTKKVTMNWDVGQSFEYLGFFMVGYVIKNRTKYKGNKKSALLIILGLLFELSAGFLEYHQVISGISSSELKYQILAPYSPFIVIASVLIFSGFANLYFDKGTYKFSLDTFYIYLFHGGVLDVIAKISSLTKGKQYLSHLNAAVFIPLLTILVLGVSFLLTKICLPFAKKIDNRLNISAFLMRLVKLN